MQASYRFSRSIFQLRVRRAALLRGRMLLLLVATISVGLLSACSGSASGDGAAYIRTPRPTFTPTVPSAAAAPATAQPVVEENAAPEEPPRGGLLLEGNPRVIVNSPLVNTRSGPGVDFDIVAMVERGEEFDVIGRNGPSTWWNICCVEGTSAWIIDEFVDTNGPVDVAPNTEGEPAITAPLVAAPAAPATATPAPPLPTQPPAVTATPTAAVQVASVPPVDSFALIGQEQFEWDTVRIYLYVLDGNNSLPGYSLRVLKDGAELPVTAQSLGGTPAFTWPFSEERQRYQNMKVEFEDVEPAGAWEVQLIDGDGNVVGPSATFTLQADDAERELYVRYERQ